MSNNTNGFNICFIDGDIRQYYAAAELSKKTDVNVFVSGETLCGFCGQCGSGQITVEKNIQRAIYNSNAVILPILSGTCGLEISFDNMVKELARKNGIVIGGRLSPYMVEILEENKIIYFDYCKDENFTIKNAFITAEGALKLAMDASSTMLRDAVCAIVGFGRIGKALARLLLSIGNKPTVYARRQEVRTLATEMGCNTVTETSALDVDIIFNTVPERIITNEALMSFSDKRIFIELASMPGGFDPDIATQFSHTVIDGRGLPGKYAPVSAGIAVAESIASILNL